MTDFGRRLNRVEAAMFPPLTGPDLLSFPDQAAYDAWLAAPERDYELPNAQRTVYIGVDIDRV